MYIIFTYIYIYIYIHIINLSFLPLVVHHSGKFSSEDVKRKTFSSRVNETEKPFKDSLGYPSNPLHHVHIHWIRVLKIAVEIAMNSCTLLQLEPVTINTWFKVPWESKALCKVQLFHYKKRNWRSLQMLHTFTFHSNDTASLGHCD